MNQIFSDRIEYMQSLAPKWCHKANLTHATQTQIS
jgi:hypothetical protein